MSDRYEAQLTALAVIEAHRADDGDALTTLHLNSAPGEIYRGLVYLIDGLLCTTAAASGATPQEVIDVFRSGMLYAAGGAQ